MYSCLWMWLKPLHFLRSSQMSVSPPSIPSCTITTPPFFMIVVIMKSCKCCALRDSCYPLPDIIPSCMGPWVDHPGEEEEEVITAITVMHRPNTARQLLRLKKSLTASLKHPISVRPHLFWKIEINQSNHCTLILNLPAYLTPQNGPDKKKKKASFPLTLSTSPGYS